MLESFLVSSTYSELICAAPGGLMALIRWDSALTKCSYCDFGRIFGGLWQQTSGENKTRQPFNGISCTHHHCLFHEVRQMWMSWSGRSPSIGVKTFSTVDLRMASSVGFFSLWFAFDRGLSLQPEQREQLRAQPPSVRGDSAAVVLREGK